MNDMNYSEKLKTGTAVGYGIGAIGEGIGYNVFFSFFSFFLTTIAGIQPAVAGVISMAAVLWDAVTDPIIGLVVRQDEKPERQKTAFYNDGVCPPVRLGHSAVHQYRDVSEHESSIFHRYEYVLLGNADQLRDSAHIFRI